MSKCTLSFSSTNILMSKCTLSFSSLLTNLLPDRGALLLSNSLALLFILVLGNFLLDSLALHVWCIMALFHLLQITLIFSYIISLSLSSLLTNLFMLSFALFLIHSLALLGISGVTLLFILCVTFFFIFSFTLFFRYLLTLLLWNRLSSGNLNGATLLSRFVFHLSIIHSVALLFIGSHFVWHLDGIALLPGLIPALVLPDC